MRHHREPLTALAGTPDSAELLGITEEPAQ